MFSNNLDGSYIVSTLHLICKESLNIWCVCMKCVTCFVSVMCRRCTNFVSKRGIRTGWITSTFFNIYLLQSFLSHLHTWYITYMYDLLGSQSFSLYYNCFVHPPALLLVLPCTSPWLWRVKPLLRNQYQTILDLLNKMLFLDYKM